VAVSNPVAVTDMAILVTEQSATDPRCRQVCFRESTLVSA
jgi:hypothetical protein